MHELLIVGVLQRAGYLLYILHDACNWQLCPFGMALAQRTIGRVIHDEERRFTIDAKIQHAHDMGVYKMGDSTRLGEEIFSILVRPFSIRYLDGHLRFEVDMLAQIDFSETAASNQAHEAVV